MAQDKWARWNHYQKYGVWPKSESSKTLSRAQQAAASPVHPEHEAAPASAWDWAMANPQAAAYDNDGNPVPMSHWAGKDMFNRDV